MKSRFLRSALAGVLALALVPAAASAAEWTPTPVALPEGSTAGALEAVNCPSAGSCVAVGESAGAPEPIDGKPMAVTEAGGAWGQGVTIGRPVGSWATSLLGVSCPAVGSCVAIGYEEEAAAGYWDPKEPVAAVETDGAWGETFKITPPGGDQYAILTSVSCPAVDSCVAVGGDPSGPIAAVETDGSWGPAAQIQPTAPATEPPTPNATAFGGVSCATVGTCVGAGITWNPAGERRPGAATTNDDDWGEAVQVVPPGPATPNFLAAVSCPAIGSCVAVGGNGSELFAVTYADGAWAAPTPIAVPDGAPSAVLTGVTCPGIGSCLAAGSYYPANNQFEGRPMLASEAGGTWGGAVPLLAPEGASYAWLKGVSCTAAGPCEAVGVSGTNTTATDQLPVTYAGELAGIESTRTGTSGSVAVTTIDSPRGGGAAAGCSISPASTSIQVNRAHVAQVKLTDTGGAVCDGTLSLSVKAKSKGKGAKGKPKKPKKRVIGRGSVRLAPGTTATIPVRLNRAGKTALAKAAGHLKASLAVDAGTVKIIDGVRLRAAKKKNRRHRGAAILACAAAMAGTAIAASAEAGTPCANKVITIQSAGKPLHVSAKAITWRSSRWATLIPAGRDPAPRIPHRRPLPGRSLR